MKKTFLIALSITACFLQMNAQERLVKIDFESGAFYNSPSIPFSEPFVINGETGRDIEFVKVNIYYEGGRTLLHSFAWNRNKSNPSETFSIVVPAILKSGTKYDFEITTYKLMSPGQKEIMFNNLEERIYYFLQNNIHFDGKNVTINRPNDVYRDLQRLIRESLRYLETKNTIDYQAPSSLVLQELKNQSDYRFNIFIKKTNTVERDSIANELISVKVEYLTKLIISELAPYFSSQLVQHHRQVSVTSVSTDKEPFSLPVNAGIYAWNRNITIDNLSVQNTNFTYGAGLTLPFSNKNRFVAKSKVFDSFGYSLGVLFQPIKDANGTELITPGINLPVYTGLGFRVLKVVRFNAGVIVLGEKGLQDFSKLIVVPTVGMALELNLWMGVKK